MDNKLIYIADDEVNICNIIKSFLIKDGFQVQTFYDGDSIFAAFNKKIPDMIIIDIMMPGMDGYSICSLVRSKSNIPIIIISAKDTEPDKITGLTLGGDDYLTKPFSPLELIARIKSIFRRIDLDKNEIIHSRVITAEDIYLYNDLKEARFGEINIGLTGMEYSLLHYLVTNKNRAISRNELLDKIWGFEMEVETRATDDMIKRIRKKLSLVNSTLKIETVWGFGFKIQDKG